MRVAHLFVYPVKSCGGIAVESWPVEERGLRFDRRFVVVAPDGRFITQRDCPQLALVRTGIDGGELVLSTAPGASARVPLEPRTGETMPVRVWDDSVDGLLPSPAADALLTATLARPCRLAWMPDSSDRATAPKRGDPRRLLSFCDATPIHLATLAALDDLNERLRIHGGQAVAMDRFRANIVVAGGDDCPEERWSSAAINDVELRVTDTCKRCKVVTIDQCTAESSSPEPMSTLKSYRFEEGGVSTGAAFGLRMTVERPGRIMVGDAVRSTMTTQR